MLIFSLNAAYSSEKTVKPKNIYWGLYASNIGIQVGISTSIYVKNIVINSVYNNFDSEIFKWDTIGYILQILIIDSINAIPLAGPYISSSLYFFCGALYLSLYSLKISGQPVKLSPNDDSILSNGIYYLINSTIILPFGIILSYLNNKYGVFNKNKATYLDISLNLNNLILGLNIKI